MAALPESGDTEPLMYGEAWDLPYTGPTQQRYIILSQQRTGSTYLTRRLGNLEGRLGLPSEYIGERAIPRMAARLIPGLQRNANVALPQYMRAIERVRTTPDGWFGIKVQPHHLVAVTGDKLRVAAEYLNQFDRVIVLTRRDKLGQAVSGAIAQETQVWVTDGAEPPLDDQRIPELLTKVMRNLTQYMKEEAEIMALRETVKRPMLTLDYAEIEADGQACFDRVIDFLDPSARGHAESSLVPVPRKPVGRFAQEVRRRFLAHIQGQDAA